MNKVHVRDVSLEGSNLPRRPDACRCLPHFLERPPDGYPRMLGTIQQGKEACHSARRAACAAVSNRQSGGRAIAEKEDKVFPPLQEVAAAGGRIIGGVGCLCMCVWGGGGGGCLGTSDHSGCRVLAHCWQPMQQRGRSHVDKHTNKV